MGTLAWTATGGNYDQGKVGFYQILIRRNVSATAAGSSKRRTRRSADEEETEFVPSSVKPGERETVTLNVIPGGGKNESFDFVVIGVDDSQNTGEDSNMVTAGLGYVADIRDGELPFPPSSSNLVVYVVVAVVVVLILVGILIGVMVHKKKKVMSRDVSVKNKKPEKQLRGIDNAGMVQVQVHSIDTTQQFKYSAGKEEAHYVNTRTTTTSSSSSSSKTTTKTTTVTDEGATTRYFNRRT